MNESAVLARMMAMQQLLNELKAQLDAITQRLVAAEQSLAGKWIQ